MDWYYDSPTVVLLGCSRIRWYGWVHKQSQDKSCWFPSKIFETQMEVTGSTEITGCTHGCGESDSRSSQPGFPWAVTNSGSPHEPRTIVTVGANSVLPLISTCSRGYSWVSYSWVHSDKNIWSCAVLSTSSSPLIHTEIKRSLHLSGSEPPCCNIDDRSFPIISLQCFKGFWLLQKFNLYSHAWVIQVRNYWLLKSK